ncbi:hypothetical protein APHAL10511_000546 [Amanita phalloides]|nr:hypothetical protein APHAL10511_000546 [Amanita phalloides]
MTSSVLSPSPAQASDPRTPRPTLDHQGLIFIYHPDYNNTEFFRIPCFPRPTFLGAHLGLILDACEIIANNRHGFLGTSKDRTSGIPSDNRDLILFPGTYYYHLDASILEYPIVTEFDAWTPPSQLPQHWLDVAHNSDSTRDRPSDFTVSTTWSDVSRMINTADVYCAMTRDSSRLDACHLVPKANIHWA